MNILGVIFFQVNDHRWHEELAISSGEDRSSTLEGVFLSCLKFPNLFPCEDLVRTDDSNPLYIGIEADIVTITTLGWTRMDFFELFK